MKKCKIVTKKERNTSYWKFNWINLNCKRFEMKWWFSSLSLLCQCINKQRERLDLNEKCKIFFIRFSSFVDDDDDMHQDDLTQLKGNNDFAQLLKFLAVGFFRFCLCLFVFICQELVHVRKVIILFIDLLFTCPYNWSM